MITLKIFKLINNTNKWKKKNNKKKKLTNKRINKNYISYIYNEKAKEYTPLIVLTQF